MKEVLQVAYLRRLQDFYLFESVKDGIFSQRNKKAINSELNLFKISVFAIIKEPEAEDRSIHFIQGDTH